MPQYCYKEQDGTLHWRVFSIAKCKKWIVVDGNRANRCLVEELKGFRNTPGTYPFASDAAGVHPDQIPDAVKESVDNGVPTRFTPDGRAIMESKQHRKRYLESVGMYDRNGGNSDPVRRADRSPIR